MGISYEFIKKLKDAGIKQEHINPQCDGGRECCVHGNYLERNGETVYVPTLEELIEACGDRFGALYRDIMGNWQAHALDEHLHPVVGINPLITVANLYLALHEKNN